ncbi:uncharacterized protein HD556DRAFT_1447198 [Suillus plorans]|uniref:Uncharacterized protein n=1 Tax=Suillus plorans TaxID=116603 RepID=A0A9P7AIL5_9AGAM|nr:uncharacterized protein HD556DRAFT_1447198 [Suillus plorans]KAG1789134.1 hypothetical protein HD556DRAFT_1447198 [Suillus plorans]
MGRRPKSSQEQQAARQQSKQVHYLRHIGYEHIKARHRWRQGQGAHQGMALDAFETLNDISSRMYTSGSRNHNGCQDRVCAVLHNIDVQGWNLVRPQFLEELTWARTLLKDAEELSTLVAKFEAEEEILSLADKDPEVLDDALFNYRLVWQRV